MRLTNLFVLFVLFVSCKSNNKLDTRAKEDIHTKGTMTQLPSILVYKTKKDYDNKVPVILSDDKTKIIAYPHPKDLTKNKDNYLVPTHLNKGYLLDNKGINENVAFLKYTYQEYADFEAPPTLEKLYRNILDKNPLTELYDCGKRPKSNNIKEWLNKLIEKRTLQTTCNRLK